MSDRLKLAFEQAAMLSEQEQEAFAELLLAELHEDREWQRRFETSQAALATLAEEARADRKRGSSEALDDLLK